MLEGTRISKIDHLNVELETLQATVIVIHEVIQGCLARNQLYDPTCFHKHLTFLVGNQLTSHVTGEVGGGWGKKKDCHFRLLFYNFIRSFKIQDLVIIWLCTVTVGFQCTRLKMGNSRSFVKLVNWKILMENLNCMLILNYVSSWSNTITYRTDHEQSSWSHVTP